MFLRAGFSARSLLSTFAPPILAFAMTTAAYAADFHLQKIALRGDLAPGTEPGTTFALTPFEYVPMVPTIDEAGRVGFAARLEGPAVTAANSSGIWFGTPGDVALVARAGDPAPGSAGAVFHDFPVDIALQAPVTGSDRSLLAASLSGSGVSGSNAQGIWSLSAAGLELVARGGDPAPGLPAGSQFGSTLYIVEVNRSGQGTISGTITGPGVTSTNDEVLWTDRSGGWNILLREGDPAPGAGSGVVYGGAGEYLGTGSNFESVRLNDANRLGLQANVTGQNVDTFNNEALWVEQGGGMTLLAREGAPAPGMGGGSTFGGNGVTVDFGELSFNELGQTAFVTRVDRGSSVTFPLYSNHTGTLQPIAVPGTPAPGTSENYGIVGYQALNDAGRIAFRSSFANGPMYFPPFGVWWDQPGAPGEIEPLVLPGDPLPERPGTTVASVNWIHGFTSSGLIVLGADLADAQSESRPALLYADATGDVRLLVAAGDLFDVHGDGTDYREVTGFLFGGVNEDGQMAVRIDFSGGFGIYRASSVQSAVIETGRIPIEFAQNRPNPFTSSTTLSFELRESARVTLDVYDVAGRLVIRLLDESRDAGAWSVAWDGRDASGGAVPAGIYWARLRAPDMEERAIRMVRVGE